MTKREAKAAMWLERVVLRGIEGIIADKYLEVIVTQEWRSADQADEALRNQFEAKYMAQQVYAQCKGIGL